MGLMAPHGKGPSKTPLVGTCGVLEHMISPLEMAAISNFTGDAHCRAVERVDAHLREHHPKSTVSWLLWEPQGGSLYGNAIGDLKPDTAIPLTRLMRRALRQAESSDANSVCWASIDSGIVHVSLHQQQVLGLVIQGIPKLQTCLDLAARLQEIVQ
ncbi:unnamed protein product [Phytomonas sp. Hart1]|nr:unnamed protein product [Phytomonas sp. Hart1]|eukprot:CCW69297.1 unnamed protein product [Phytomonas sp. isolate Hart1]